MAYAEQGSGAPLVLVHGHPFDRTMWAPQLASFGAPGSGLRVITPDLRGYGTSEPAPGGADGGDPGTRRTTLETFAHDLAALLDALGLGRERIVLGGLSMGGQIVMEFARRFPGRLRGLVLAATSPYAETDAGRRDRNALADRLLREGMHGYADEVLDRMVAPYNVTGQPEVAGHVLRMMRGTPPEGAAAALRGRAERRDHTASLAQIGVPALVVAGRDDPFTPVAEMQDWYRRIPDATLTVIEGAAHLPNLERPAEFDAALAGFLDRLP
ncbi:alpha/beta fold hydrolase [Streptomyces pinistramenti]|uniref:alpha/beta fold hydrolase n=1 Tax=Streptomyces pinistramenti TaxID=2884812 RepID=UPI001D0968CD|nr:alpha/beta hydrolase [Streptomyces pinistramenti]MCB5910656.1 alpha/beta hydrolase [Streptomyces pinistramenti]